MIETREHDIGGEILTEHRHDGYEYWHPASRVHSESTPSELPEGHITENPQKPESRGLQVQSFDWPAWDDGCHAKGICQGYTSLEVPEIDEGAHTRLTCGQPMHFSDCQEWHEPPGFRKELHHRDVYPDMQGIAEVYWQCPHCKQLQKPIQWVQGARLETYNVEVRGSRTVIWVRVSSGAWFVFVIRAYGSLQGVAMGIYQGTVYAVGNQPPLQLPDETAVILARRMWYRLTRGYWSDKKKEDDCE